jgi:hypothetical protein
MSAVAIVLKQNMARCPWRESLFCSMPIMGMNLNLSLTAHLLLLISLQSYKLAPPPKKRQHYAIEDDSDDVMGANL